jgi:hypothetical protein
MRVSWGNVPQAEVRSTRWGAALLACNQSGELSDPEAVLRQRLRIALTDMPPAGNRFDAHLVGEGAGCRS